jgi:hypothetical protein
MSWNGWRIRKVTSLLLLLLLLLLSDINIPISNPEFLSLLDSRSSPSTYDLMKHIFLHREVGRDARDVIL